MTTTFESLPLSPEMQQSLKAMGFSEATAIQAESLPFLLEGRDLIGQAQTGTGKTAAFAIPMVECLDIDIKQPQVLVLCPTRELAIQVSEQFKSLTKHQPLIKTVCIYGGEPINRQFRALEKKPQVIVGTPGRLLDHIRRGSIQLKTVKAVVLDEADEMLDMGFRDDLEAILNTVPESRQTILFSATMSKPILEMTHKYQRNPQHIKIEKAPTEAINIEQLYVEVQRRKKIDTLMYLIQTEQLKLALVFCNTKHQVDELVLRLKTQGYAAAGLHGGMSQPKRDRVMKGFRKGKVQFLIATDVAARGIDVQNIEAVFNYDIPQDIENYVHRIGRTGRAGSFGRAYTFIEYGQLFQLKRIRKALRGNLLKHEVPAFA